MAAAAAGFRASDLLSMPSSSDKFGVLGGVSKTGETLSTIK